VKEPTRRKFLHRCAICAGAMALPPSWARMLAAAEHSHQRTTPVKTGIIPLPFKYLTPEQAATVEAIADQIIPADADPGAKWAGVVHYVDLGLAGDFTEYRSTYDAGLRRLVALAREVSDQHFAELDASAQTKILEKLEADDTREGDSPAGSEFFRLVRRHTIEGFFGDPIYGGNRDLIGWRILRFEG
jgi:gluconate 2-dehydrogenase gamma chain